MNKISVVIRRDTGAIEITPELVEQALNFYFGVDASFTVFEAAEQPLAPDALRCSCGRTIEPHYPNCLSCGAANPAHR